MTYTERAAAMSRDEMAEILIKYDEMARQLAFFKKQLFGPKSERRVIDPSGDQLWIGETEGAGEPDAPAPTVTVAEHERRRRPRRAVGGDEPVRFDPSVPVETIEVTNLDVPESERDQYVVVSRKITERLAQRPGPYVVLRYVRTVLKRKSDGMFSCPPAPESVLEKSMADVSFLAGLVIDKLSYHLPLHRQHQRLAAAGVRIGRSTLTGYFQRVADLLDPIYHAQLGSILHSKVLAMDETPIKAGPKKNKPPGTRGAMHTGYFWPLYGDHDEVAFPFAATRAHAVVAKTLGEYAGTLLTDGYEAYEKYAATLAGVVHAQCWGHVRRHLVAAESSEPALAAEALDRIGTLYELEAEHRTASMTPQEILAHRRTHSRPVVDAFFAWLEQVRVEHLLLPSSPFTKAIDYALGREKALRVFLDDPAVAPDTNHLERAIRPVAVGRRNWLFCSTEAGAHQLGALQSLLVTCRLHGVDPYTYLVDVLQRVHVHPAKRVHELTPRRWKDLFADDPMRSDLDRATARPS